MQNNDIPDRLDAADRLAKAALEMLRTIDESHAEVTEQVRDSRRRIVESHKLLAGATRAAGAPTPPEK